MSWNRIFWAVASPGEIPMSAAAAGKALQLAARSGAELEIFHCVYDADIARGGRFGSRGAQLDVREIVEQRRRQLERNAERLRGRGVQVRTSVRWDAPAFEGIVRQVRRHKADLLIAQSTRTGDAQRTALRQTDFKLIETCPCPLLLIRTPRPYSASRIVAAVDPMHVRAKAVQLDGAVIDEARALADVLGGDLVVFHALAPWDVVARAAMTLRRAPKAGGLDARSAYGEGVAARLRELAEEHGVAGDRVRILEGRAEQCLPAFARSEQADIVAMGAISRSQIERILIGDTAERVLDALDSDVLIVKAPQFASPVSPRSAHHIDRNDMKRGKYIFL